MTITWDDCLFDGFRPSMLVDQAEISTPFASEDRRFAAVKGVRIRGLVHGRQGRARLGTWSSFAGTSVGTGPIGAAVCNRPACTSCATDFRTAFWRRRYAAGSTSSSF